MCDKTEIALKVTSYLVFEIPDSEEESEKIARKKGYEDMYDMLFNESAKAIAGKFKSNKEVKLLDVESDFEITAS